MKKSMLGLALSALLASASFAQTATPVMQPQAPAVQGSVITESAAPQAKVAKKAKKVKKAGKKGAKKAAGVHAKHATHAKAKKHHKLQA
ncbi:hypothetical protein [Paucibacter soli]|uniref:hypothetical protein n=1 Tax=Paucibacter soli TaxID=3133433 RepID=UPI00309E0C6B